MATRSGAQVLVESLVNEGISTIFGIPGVGTLPVYDALIDVPALRHVETRHEQGAVFMADGHARATGEIAVAFTSGGPGSFNTVTAMASAYNDSVPLLHIMNENPASIRRRGRGHFHDMRDQFGVFRTVSDFATQVVMADEIPAAIHQAMHALRNRRPRPAVVEIAEEAFGEATDVALPAPAVRTIRKPDGPALEAAVELLGRAASPLIWAGGGIGNWRASAALIRVAERLGAPVITTQKGKGAMPFDHPLHVGNWANEAPVRRLIAGSDALLAVGTRFSYFPTGGWSLRIRCPIVQIDIDPAGIGINYPVDVPVVSDAEAALTAIESALAARDHRPRPGAEETVAGILDQIDDAVGVPLERRVLDGIRTALPDEALVFNDPTTIAFWARSLWTARHPRTWFIPSGFGTLGSSMPSAIGAKLARPDVPVVCLIGDAGLMFTVQDLMTAVQEGIPVIVMVFNDRGYGVERRHQDHRYGRRTAVDLVPPDFVAMANAFGAVGVRVDDPAETGTVLASVLETDRPVLLEIPNEFAHPGYGSFGSWEDHIYDPGAS